MTVGVLKAGLIGVGFGGLHLAALRQMHDVSVIALADAGSGKADHVARDLPDAVRTYRSGEDLLAHEQLDLVIIASPPETHRGLVLQAIARNCAVLCEKPFGLTLAEAQEMATAAAASAQIHAVGFQFRYEPGIAALRSAIAARRLGDVHRIEVDWLTSGGARADRAWSWRDDQKYSGGVLTEFATHVFDYLAVIAGAPVSDVFAQSSTAHSRRPSPEGMRSVTTPDRLDMLVTLGKVTALVAISNVEPVALGHRIAVHGSAGRMTWHHRPPFASSDQSLTLHLAGGQEHVLAIAADSADAVSDTRLPAAVALLGDWLASRASGRASPTLPAFSAGLAARKAVDLAARHIARAG